MVVKPYNPRPYKLPAILHTHTHTHKHYMSVFFFFQFWDVAKLANHHQQEELAKFGYSPGITF